LFETDKTASLSLMTVDSIPISGLGRTGRWFYGSAR
jgi:hypothetical protein